MNLDAEVIPGECYGNALKILILNYEKDDLVICHGKVDGHGPIEGYRIMHGWVEDDLYCYDLSGRTMKTERIPKLIYYTLGNIKNSEIIKYSKKDVIRLGIETGHAGPWNKEQLEYAENEEGSVYEQNSAN